MKRNKHVTITVKNRNEIPIDFWSTLSGRSKSDLLFDQKAHLFFCFVFNAHLFLHFDLFYLWASAVIPKVCSADYEWSARLAEVVRESLYHSIFCPSRTTKFF